MNFRNSITGKLWVYMTLLTIITIVFSGIVLSNFFEDFYINIKQNEMVNEGQQLIALIVRGIAPSELVDISKFINAYAIVVDRRGLIMACSNKFYFGNELPINGSKLSNVLKGEIVVDKGYLPQLGTMLVVALPITRDGNVVGGLILLSPMASMQESISQIRRGIVFVAVGAVVLSTILSFGLSKNITRPLVKMKKVAENMAKGKFDDKVEPETDDEIGTLARTLNFLSDALKENIAALSLEKNQLRNVLLSMTDGVITFDSTGRVLMANPQVWELLGSDPQSEDGEVKALSVLGEQVQKVKKSKKPLQEEIKLEGKILSVRLAPLFNEESEIWGVVAVLQDVTREKKLESLRREFVANVSHELRTPLTYLQGYTEALIDDMIEDPAEQKKYLSIILEETLRLRRLVNDLLDLSLMEAGHLNLKKESFMLNKLIERVLKKVNPVAEKKGVSLVAKIKELPLVLADEDRIEQVLINLIDNALRYTEKGGEITIEASASPQSVVVCVKDQGPGIPEDELPFIWERFHKVDKARTRDNGGTGLGLAIVKGIIEAHGGKVWVKNLEEKGAVFCFSIPYA